MLRPSHILTLSCADRPGIVAAVSTALAGEGINIVESNQFWEQTSNAFYMRIAVDSRGVASQRIERCLEQPAREMQLGIRLFDTARRPRIIAMVSRHDHALLHLLYQIKVAWLEADIVAIVSNHEDSRANAEAHGIPYFHWPVAGTNKREQEDRLRALAATCEADLIVLARYMQILSPDLARDFHGRIINIHHSFLPSFKGAKPYHQAHERGVKLIGATAHYVTPDLDEGPIIEQETERVRHSMSVDDYIAVGRNIESRVLARAVRLHVENRIVLHGHRTVVFD